MNELGHPTTEGHAVGSVFFLLGIVLFIGFVLFLLDLTRRRRHDKDGRDDTW